MKCNINIIDNITLDSAVEFLKDIDYLNYNSKDELQATEWKSTGPFWADFRPRANFSILRNILKSESSTIVSVTEKFISLCNNHSYDYDIDKLLLMKCHGTVETHVDQPYRYCALNWYLFSTYGSELHVGNVVYNPKQGDLIWINTSLPHKSVHHTDDPIYILSM